MRIRLRSTHPDATAELGGALADALAPGDLVMLTGPLGAGKTRFVQGVAAGLGVTGRVTSPTFVLVRRHEGRIPLVHVDAYRLADPRDLLTLDDDVLDGTVVTCVEWGDTVRDALPASRLECDVRVEGDHGDAPRSLTLDLIGAGWTDRGEVLAERLSALAARVDALAMVDTERAG
jgi:tRNA threonylcarbamoyladenosine biosynthesis protein TsaE